MEVAPSERRYIKNVMSDLNDRKIWFAIKKLLKEN